MQKSIRKKSVGELYPYLYKDLRSQTSKIPIIKYRLRISFADDSSFVNAKLILYEILLSFYFQTL